MRQYFNPRSPHGERQAFSACLRRGCPYFNPRSPHGERPRRNRKSSRSSIFQSTPPHGERRQSLDTSSYHGHISIHAPRMGSDTPDGEHYDAVQRFQSTPPAWGATVRLYFPLNVRRISIHAPPHGERRNLPSYVSEGIYFNPRSRMGSDKKKPQSLSMRSHFNPRSRMGSDHKCEEYKHE